MQRLLERVEDLGAHPQALRERAGAGRDDHELLEVDGVVGVRAAVEDVHHRHRQHARGVAAEVAPQRQPLLDGGRVGGGQRDAEDRVGAQAALVRRAVELDQRAVERGLVGRVEPGDGLGDLAVDVADGLRDALAAVGARRRRAARWPRTRPSTRRWAPRRGRRRRSAARGRPRPSGCPGCRGSGGRGPSRSCSSALVQPCSHVQGQLLVGGQLAPRRRRTASRSPRRPRPGRGSGRRRRAAPARVHLQLARHVDGREEHVADLVEGRRHGRCRRPRAPRARR